MSRYLYNQVASPLEPYVLLGRDVLNHFRITLDGPNLVLYFAGG